jgi:hypothetical protein
MHGQADAGTPLRQAGHHSAGVRFSRAADENILGTTPQKAPARHPGWHIVDKPCGQDPRQESLCPPGREPPAWRGPLVRGAQGSRLESPGVEPLAEESQSSPLTAPRVDTLSPRTPGQIVDTSTDSCIDDPGKVQRPTLLTQRVPRLVWPGPLSDALGDPMQLRLEDGRQPHHHRSLAKRVLAAGGAEWPLRPSVLLAPDARAGRCHRPMIAQPLVQVLKGVSQVLGVLLRRHLVPPGALLVRGCR